jgi:hypothetical protein
VIVAALAAVPSVHAQVADLTKATCAQMMDLPRNDRGQLIVWLHGYYAGAAQRAMIDRTKLEETVAAIQQACERNRTMPLVGAEARAIFLGEPALQPPAGTQPQAPTAPRPQ